MKEYDYLIVGAGAAGCVLAYRLSEDPTASVALIEAGPDDVHPFISMPKGVAKVRKDPRHLWTYTSAPEPGNAMKPDVWVRGRVLGGSTAINGMMYVRGQPSDFDGIAELVSDDWSWKHIGAAYGALEGHELGPAPTRGKDGPLKISMPTQRGELSEAMIASGARLGWPVKTDVNEPDEGEGIGYAPRTIHRGRRQSAAEAFLRPIEHRKNFTVITDAVVDKVVFTNKRAVGVTTVRRGISEIVRAKREIILSCGALSSPGILERSGIGDPERLAGLGVPVVCANADVGENLIEHRAIIMQWKLKHQVSQNREYSGWRLLRATLQYYLTKDGPMSSGAYEIGAWFKTRPGLNRPDAQFLIAPFSFDFSKQRTALEPFPGMNVVTYPLRPTSRGRVHIASLDPSAPPKLEPNYRSTQEDRDIMIGAVRAVRHYVKQEPLSSLIETETMPGSKYDTDAQILDAYDRFGTCAYHAVGSCRMGADPTSVVDPELRVRGTDGLRIMDTSVMPVIPSGNTNGPTMAMAWRGADIILRDRR
jgi:choline dehydrogenase-like flavoprotein